MAEVESFAAEVAAEVATSLAARAGNVPEIPATYTGPNKLRCEQETATASAPAITVHTGERPSIRPYTVPRGWVGPKDLQSRCTAAARLTLTGKNYTPDHVAECAAEIMLATLERHPLKSGHVDPEAASMARLTHLAANWRRGEDRRRVRDDTDAATRASITGKVFLEVDGGQTAGPMTAARTAIYALQNLGLDPKAARRVWPLAYTAARASEGADGATLAAELGMSHAAYRQAISRARSYVPSAKPWTGPVTGTEYPNVYSYTDHLEAVCAECEAIATDPKSVATDASEGPDWPARSASAYKGAPTTCTRDASVKRDGRRNYARPSWTNALAPNTARRLATASQMKRARELARTAEETTRRRLAAGLPATVR